MKISSKNDDIGLMKFILIARDGIGNVVSVAISSNSAGVNPFGWSRVRITVPHG